MTEENTKKKLKNHSNLRNYMKGITPTQKIIKMAENMLNQEKCNEHTEIHVCETQQNKS